MQTTLLSRIDGHLEQLKKASRIKQYLKAASEIRESIASFMDRLVNLRFGNIRMTEGLTFETPAIVSVSTPTGKETQKKENTTKEKQIKGASMMESLSLFRQYQSVNQVAVERHLSAVTVESHLAQAIAMGELSVYDLIPIDRVNAIIPFIGEVKPGTPLSPIKQRLGDEFSYLEIKAVLNHLIHEKNKG